MEMTRSASLFDTYSDFVDVYSFTQVASCLFLRLG